MKYQLVLQFSVASIEDYDLLISLEDRFAESLGDLGYVDGHDAGTGEMNIFIVTDQPERTFERVKANLNRDCYQSAKIAYREIGKDQYTILHPQGLDRFAIS
jgi:hypothetical protein